MYAGTTMVSSPAQIACFLSCRVKTPKLLGNKVVAIGLFGNCAFARRII